MNFSHRSMTLGFFMVALALGWAAAFSPFQVLPARAQSPFPPATVTMATGPVGGAATVSGTSHDLPAVEASFGQGSYTVAEGSSVTVKVTLSDDPKRTVIIPITKMNQGGVYSDDYSGVPSSVEFQSGDMEQSFTFAARHDGYNDDGNSVKLGFGMLPDGVSAGSVNEATVSIIDDDPEMHAMLLEPEPVEEDSRAVRVGVRWVTQEAGVPNENYSIDVQSIAGTAESGVECKPGADYLPVSEQHAANPDEFKAFVNGEGEVRYRHTEYFYVTILDDNVAEDTEYFLLRSHASSGFGYSGTSQIEVAIIDDDIVGVTVEPTAIAVAEGSTASYTVALDTQPLGHVTVTINDPSNTGVAAEPDSLTFTPADWSIPRTVTVAADPDGDESDEAPTTITHTVTSTDDGDYEGLSADSVTVVVKDDDGAGVSISETSLHIEEGNSAVYSVVLDTQPTGDVTVAIGVAGTDLSLDPTALIFTDQNWNVGQEVTVTAEPDDDAVDEPEVAIAHTVTSADSDYDALSADSVAVTVRDDETVGVGISPISLHIKEGSSAVYSVVLGSQPTGDVTVAIGGVTGSDLSVDRTNLTFTAQDWNVAQEVTVTAVLDVAIGVALEFDIIHAVTSVADGEYDGLSADGVTVTARDPATLGVAVTPTELTIDEGTSSTYTVALYTPPTAEVTVTIDPPSNTGVRVSPALLTFTPQDWNTPQTVTVRAASDDNESDERETITHSTAGGDYSNVVRVDQVTVTARDDDPQMGYVLLAPEPVQEDVGKLRIYIWAVTKNAGVPNITYSERTSFIDYTAEEYSDFRRSSSFLVHFAAEDFEEFVNSAGETRYRQASYYSIDIIDDNRSERTESFILELEVLDVHGCESLSHVEVTINDDDIAGVTVDPTDISVVEGSTSTYTMVLDTRPYGDVTVTINDPSNTEITADPPSLTFNTANWKVPQTVTVTAAHDVDRVDEPEVDVTHTVSSNGDGDYGGETEQSFPFLAIWDFTNEDGESVKLGFGTLPPGVSAGAVSETTVSIFDDELPRMAVKYGQGLYTVAEGSSVTVKVILETPLGSAVTIPLTKTDQGGATSDDYGGVPSSVEFQEGESVQSFTFTAVMDSDDDGESVKLGFGNLPTGVSVGSPAETTISITDDAVPSVTVNFEQGSYAVEEEILETVKVILSAKPERTVTIPLTKMNQGGATNSDYLRVPGSVEFQSRLSADSVTVAVEDDDPPVTVSFGSGSYTVAEGGSETVTVKLNEDPERTVSISLTDTVEDGASAGDYSVPSSVVFNSGEISKTVVFMAAADAIDDDGEKVKLGFGTPLPAGVTAGTPSEATVSITDDDTANLAVDPTTLPVGEAGSGDFTVKLATEPTHGVTVTVSSGDTGAATVSTGSLSFSTTNWNDTQMVTVSGVNDADADDETVTVSLTAASTDGNYQGKTGSVSVAVTDDDPELHAMLLEPEPVEEDSRAVRVGVRWVTQEAGVPNGTYPIDVLSTGGTADSGLCAPEADYLPVSEQYKANPDEFKAFVNGEGEVRYRHTEYFYVTILDDNVAEDTEYFLLRSHASSGAGYSGTSQIEVAIIDDDIVGVTVEPAAIAVARGSTASYTVALDTPPLGNVTVTINDPSNTEVAAEPDSLTFTPTDWFIPRTVTVAADPDGDETDEAPTTVTHTVSSTDDNDYEGLSADGVTVVVKDDGSAGVSISETAVHVGEGDSASYTVVLDTQPTGDVTVAIGGVAGTDLSLDPTALIFTTQNWNVGQDVTVTAEPDDDAVDEPEVVITHTVTSAADSDYDALSADSVAVTVRDDETVGVGISPISLHIKEGSSAVYSVVLGSQPTGDVTVAIGGVTGSDLSVDRTNLTFTAQDWNVAQEVTVTAVLDVAIGVALEFDIIHAVTSVADGEYDGLSADDVTVTARDPATVGVAVTPTELTIDEGTSSTYTVALYTQPTAEVTVETDRAAYGSC